MDLNKPAILTNTPPMLPGALPYFRHALQFRFNQYGLMNKGMQQIGKIFAFNMLGNPVAVLGGAEVQKTFFESTGAALSMEEPYEFLAAIFGKVAFLADHETYLLQRPIIHGLFGRKKMVSYLPMMQREVQPWLDNLSDEGEINITEELLNLVQLVASACFLGDDIVKKIGAEFWPNYTDLSLALDPVPPPHWPLPKFIRRDRAMKRLIEMMKPIIEERRVNRIDDAFQDLIELEDANGKRLDDDIAKRVAIAVLFAGHETTAGQAAWTIIHLLQSPEYLKLVQGEINEALPKDAEIDHVKMREFNLINMAVLESGRLGSSAETLFRLVQEDLEVDGYTIPKGWLVMTSTVVAHQQAYFSNPEKYDPLRFSIERREDKAHMYAMVPFGGSIHKCAGMNFANTEMQIITALFFQQFEAELLSDDVKIERSLGSSRPTKAMVRIKRKQ